ncbi:MAG TPA: hypothetical protein VJ201_02515 [Candidatus Babeliales bacterium]|nr:hypothetical protein [Candidatus Babeliales bacterium]
MKKYSVQLVNLVLFSAIFAPGIAVGMNYAKVYVQNNLMTALQIGDKIIEPGEVQFLDDSTNPYLFAQVYRKGDSPTSSDNKNVEYKEQLEKMYLHPGASLLVTIDRSIWSPTWTYTWEWVNASDLEEKRHKTLSEKTTSLPFDVKKIIANNALRLILREASYNPEILLKKQWRATESVTEAFTSITTPEVEGKRVIEKAPLIDTVILLIENGADPNTKIYGNTVLHLLMCHFMKNTEMTLEEIIASSFFALFDFKKNLNTLKIKIELLAKHKVNINEASGITTPAHKLIWFVLKTTGPYKGINSIEVIELFDSMWTFLSWLKELGMDFTTIKNHTGVTACEYGWDLINSLMLGRYQQDKLNELCSPKK